MLPHERRRTLGDVLEPMRAAPAQPRRQRGEARQRRDQRRGAEAVHRHRRPSPPRARSGAPEHGGRRTQPVGPLLHHQLDRAGPQAIRAAPARRARAAASRTPGRRCARASTSPRSGAELAPRARRGVGDGGHAGRAQRAPPPRRVRPRSPPAGSGPTRATDGRAPRRTRGRSAARGGARRPAARRGARAPPRSAPTHAGCGDAGAPGRRAPPRSSSAAVGRRPSDVFVQRPRRAPSRRAAPRARARGSPPARPVRRRKRRAVEVRIAGRERRRGAGADRRRRQHRGATTVDATYAGRRPARRSTRASSSADDASTAHGHRVGARQRRVAGHDPPALQDPGRPRQSDDGSGFASLSFISWSQHVSSPVPGLLHSTSAPQVSQR